jgi:hypothetical protein
VAERLDTIVDLAAESELARNGAGAAQAIAIDDYQHAKSAKALAVSRNDAAPPRAEVIDVAPLEKTFAATRKRYDAATSTLATASAVSAGDAAVLESAVAFARKNSVSPIDPPLLKGNLPAILDEQRAQVKRLKGDIAITEQAVAPKEQALADVHALVAKAASRATISVSPGSAKKATSIDWPTTTLPHFTGPNGEYLRVPDVEALFAKLAPEALTDALAEAVEQAYAGEPLALSADERRARLAKLKGELLAAERLEVEAVLALRQGGATDVAFRPDTSPKAILSVA